MPSPTQSSLSGPAALSAPSASVTTEPAVSGRPPNRLVTIGDELALEDRVVDEGHGVAFLLGWEGSLAGAFAIGGSPDGAGFDTGE